jgi:exodeoxyribonuclease V gamma subunit
MFFVHRSERADHLVEVLGRVLAQPLADPMTPEVVAVPTRGVERWLSQRLSHRLGIRSGRGDGVCANVDFPFPGVLVGRAAARASGFDPEADPWPPERSVWPLLDVVDLHLDEKFLAPLADHLRAASPSPAAPAGRDPAGVRRFATVRHLADLYDHYGVHRPEMVRAWAAGDDSPSWQAELWRHLRQRIGVDSPAERLQAASMRLAEDASGLDLPPRLSLFGLTRLPASHLMVLRAIAVHRDVHLFLLHPSGALWDKIAEQELHPLAGLRRAQDPTVNMAANPLLRSWGRDAREMQLVLAAHGAAGGEYRQVAGEGSTLLARIQADIRADRPPPRPARLGDEDPRPWLGEGDDSLRIHSCHGRSRQVEVLRDAVLHLLAADPSLEPRDVIVMCPDIETFAPLVHAAFGAGDLVDADGGMRTAAVGGTDIPELRIRLADRSLRQTNPLLAVADFLLELATSRITASQVLDLASREPVRRRFRFDDADLSQAERWVAGMGVRWGLDAAHRVPWGLRDLPANTWSAGLDRLLLGVTMADEDQRLFSGTLPLDDVASGNVELAGRLAELVDRLRAGLDALTGLQPIQAWRDAIASSTAAVAVAAPADSWQYDQLHRVLDEVVEEADAGVSASGVGAAGASRAAVGETARPILLDVSEVRSLLGHRLQGRPTRANFRTGDLTVCTLVPMRSVPHRVVCLLGLDDGVFPRHTARDGDDLLLQDPIVGDRDGRSEDRQLLLDAVLAATDHLVITFCGRDERTNHERPPAVPIAELLEVVDRTVRVADESRSARDDVLVCHPLQSFDTRNFTAGKLGVDGPWSFDPLNLDGARALAGPRRARHPFLTGPLPAPIGDVIQLESLVRFVEHPVRAFLRSRLGLYATNRSDEIGDSLPIELDPLEKWAVGDRLLTARLGGATAEGAVAAERARGTLPPGRLADPPLSEVSPTVEALVEAARTLPCAASEPQSMEVNLRLPDGRLLIGTVPGVREGTIVRCLYSKLAPKHRLSAWVRFLVLSAAWPELQVAAVTLGRGRKKWGGEQLIRMSTFDPLAAQPDQRASAALAGLAVMIDLYDRGMCEPLPIYCETSEAWAKARGAGNDPVDASRASWTSSYDFQHEDAQPEHVMVLGPALAFDALLDDPPRLDETGAGWQDDEPSRFGRLACRLWDGLLEHEHWQEQ